MNTYAADVAELVEKLNLRDAIHIGHSTGGGEVARRSQPQSKAGERTRIDSQKVSVTPCPTISLHSHNENRGKRKARFT
jgi:hypothetical protein